jgi:hypothetical protein
MGTVEAPEKTSKSKTKTSRSMTGAEALVQILLEEKVDMAFGYPGGAIMPVYDALYDHQETVHHVLARHEQGAIHMAQGYARASGKVGVCLATSGPGATNLITGIADAQIDSTPLVFRSVMCLGSRCRLPNGIIRLPGRRKYLRLWRKHFTWQDQVGQVRLLLTLPKMPNLKSSILNMKSVPLFEVMHPSQSWINPKLKRPLN